MNVKYSSLPNRYTTDCGPEGLRPAAHGGPASIEAHRPAPGFSARREPKPEDGHGAAGVATCRRTPESDRKLPVMTESNGLSRYRCGGLPKENAASVTSSGLPKEAGWWSPGGDRRGSTLGTAPEGGTGTHREERSRRNAPKASSEAPERDLCVGIPAGCPKARPQAGYWSPGRKQPLESAAWENPRPLFRHAPEEAPQREVRETPREPRTRKIPKEGSGRDPVHCRPWKAPDGYTPRGDPEEAGSGPE